MTTKLNIDAINNNSITFDKLASDVVMDWDAQPNEKGYIKNKTHGMLGCVTLMNNGDTMYAFINTHHARFKNSNQIFPVIRGQETVLSYGPYISLTYRDDNVIVLNDTDDMVENFGGVIVGALETISEQYIPDTIARTSQIPTTLPANGGHADSSYMSNRLDCPDTRNEQITPEDQSRGLWVDFKQKGVTGLDAEYSGVISFRPYAQAGDWTGGPMHNLAFDENGIHHRKSNTTGTGWQSWSHIPYRDEVEKCPEYHSAEEMMIIGNSYTDHSYADRLFDYKYVGGLFNDLPYNNYGGMLTFPWQRAKGNTSPNYASQLFIPHGDEGDGAIKFRTSYNDEWNGWRMVLDDENYTEFAANSDHKHNVTAAGNVSLSGSVDSNGILTISASFTGTQVKTGTPTT